jgi:hypothetical protein
VSLVQREVLGRGLRLGHHSTIGGRGRVGGRKSNHRDHRETERAQIGYKLAMLVGQGHLDRGGNGRLSSFPLSKAFPYRI